MTSRLILRTFAGGEARLTWQSLPPPSGVSKKALVGLQTGVVKGCKPNQEEGQAAPLVNSSDSEEGPWKGVSGFGRLPRPTEFGVSARRQVKRLSAVLDGLVAKPEELIFFTGTLPGSTRDSMLALSQWSGFVIHRLKAWMHDIDSRYKCLFVWEWQRRGALHLHMAVHCDKEEHRREIFDGLRARWFDLLGAVSDRSGVDVFRRAGGRGTWKDALHKCRARAEWVRKSIGAYLGKYMSKAVGPTGAKSRYFYPSRWWGSTQNLKELEKAARTEDEYFCSSTGQAEGAYNRVSPFLELVSDWSASYRHKVMPGMTMVAANASVSLLRKLFTRGLSMKSLKENTTLREVSDEFQALMWLLHNEDSEWFCGAIAEYSAISAYMRRYCQNGHDIADAPDQGVLSLSSAAHMLNYAAASGAIYRTKKLHPREVLSIKQTCRRVVNAVERYLDEKYAHSLEDLSYVGRPV